MKPIAHVGSVSGGKDSTALYLFVSELMQRGHGFKTIKFVCADTGNEEPRTLDYLRALPIKTGGPQIEIVKQDFTAEIARKRRYIVEKWPEKGVPPDLCERALAILAPSGNPFLDLCLWKGRFPSRKAQFCTEQLKVRPIFEQVICPLWDEGYQVLSMQGVRADESAERAKRRRFEKHGGYWVWRPLLRWTVDDVFAIHRRHGVEPNPLYREGYSRVGCFPCINCGKVELRNIAARAPWAIDKIEEWERLVSEASRRGASTFFHHFEADDLDPDNRAAIFERFNVRSSVDWSQTMRGGVQYDLLANIPPTACASTYGLCE